jgi:hypothetical protein
MAGITLRCSSFDINYIEHKACRVVTVRLRKDEVPLYLLYQHRRRKGAEGLAELDLRIDDILHIRTSRIGQNAAIAERSWPPLGAALEPAYDLSGRESVDDAVDEFVIIVDSVMRDVVALQECFDCLTTVFFSSVGMFEDKSAWLPQHHVIGPQGSPHGTPAVAR